MSGRGVLAGAAALIALACADPAPESGADSRIGGIETGRPSVPADTMQSGAGPSSGSDDPVEVVRAYYAAIDAGGYRRAYALWGDEGAASGQTYAGFAEGFARTADVGVETGEPGRVEGAAGSQYVTVPVVIQAATTAGAVQRFEGTYTLRRSVVDGASAAQRRWHLYSASINPTR